MSIFEGWVLVLGSWFLWWSHFIHFDDIAKYENVVS